MGALIELKNIGYSYHTLSGETGAIKDISFSVEEGEFVALVGPSGCGKSTLLSIIAGLLAPETGTIVVNNPDGSLHYPRIGYMLQHDHLFEWRTIYQNVTLGLEIHHALTPERITHVEQLLSDYGLEKFKNKRPCELSGGMKQRAALIRTLALDPQLLLLDEPFSALDPMTRRSLQLEIKQLQQKLNKTIVFVTHDMDEAIKLADRICIIQDGKVAQCDTPENILKHPANQYVTEFIGANRLWANPEYIRAADIMRRRPFTISKGRTVIQALQIMRHNSVDSLLVLDKGQTLLGVVWLEELIGKREADPIEYYISDDYIAVEGETSLKEIIATIDYDVSGIIPVIQHDRKLLGYLTKSIILATMSKQFVPEHTAGERSGVICPATL